MKYSFTKNDYFVYKLYMKQKGLCLIGAPYRCSPSSLEKRSDKTAFSYLRKKLENGNVVSMSDKDMFLRCSFELGFDEPTIIRQKFKLCYDAYIKYKKNNGSVENYLTFVSNSILYIQNYCLEKSININDYCSGDIPTILKHWKAKKVDESVVIYTRCLDRIKMSNVLQIYCKKLIKDKKKINERIYSNENLSKILTSWMTF